MIVFYADVGDFKLQHVQYYAKDSFKKRFRKLVNNEDVLISFNRAHDI